jgi:hypothetical protein
MQQHRPKNEADSLKVEASATSIAIEVKGRGASRAADALLDIISPFTNALGLLGDQFSNARRAAAIRAAAKAAKQLKDEGISSARIPPKILLPWLDGASLETDEAEGDSLTDAWAGLFVRAAKSSDAVTISYIETLKKLGKEEAELLQFFAMDTSPSYSQKFYESEGSQIFSDENPLRYRAISRLENILSKEGHIAELSEFMEHWGFQGMCQIIFFSTEMFGMVPTNYFREHEHVISNLEHLGLITTTSKIVETKAGNVEIIWFEITKYAFDLIYACQGVLTGAHEGELKHRAKNSASQ